MRILRFNESKKEKDLEEVKFDIKSFEPIEDDLVGFESDFEEIPEKEVEKIKKDITDVKKFEDFTISLTIGDNEDECNCCDICTGQIDCNCGCVDCNYVGDHELEDNQSQELQYHLMNSLPVTENVFRPGSKKFFALLKEARNLYDLGLLELTGIDKELYESTDIGKFAMFRGEMVPLDIPMEYIEELNEAEYKGRDVKLNKPMRSSGPKKYKVYVKNPKTDRVMCVNFGDVKGGLKSKSSNAKSRKSFAARHKCHLKKDKTTAGYWSCRLNRYKNLVKSGGGKYW